MSSDQETKSSTSNKATQNKSEVDYYVIKIKGPSPDIIRLGIQYEITGEMTVEELRKIIANKIGAKKPQHVRIIFGNKEINDEMLNKTLDDLGIQNKSTILVIQRLPGGNNKLKIKVKLKSLQNKLIEIEVLDS